MDVIMKRELPSSCTSESPPSVITVALGRGPKVIGGGVGVYVVDARV